jgi:hypothetical protein
MFCYSWHIQLGRVLVSRELTNIALSATCFLAGTLFSLLFHPEGGGDVSKKNVS